MPAKKKTRQMPHGRRIDVARIVSVGQARDTGEAVIRLRVPTGSSSRCAFRADSSAPWRVASWD